MQRRTFPAAVANVGDREVEAVLTTSQRARDGNVLEPAGCDLTGFRQNPVVLWSHRTDSPVGRCDAITVNTDSISARIRFAPLGISAVADEICALVKNGFVRSLSIGFEISDSVPIDPRRPYDGVRATKWELLETSFVALPSDTGAVVTARQVKDKVTMPVTQFKSANDFPRFADYLRAVVQAASGGAIDRRLQRAPTGLSEGVPPDGGFTVPTLYANEIIDSLFKTGAVASRCDRKTTTGPIADVRLPGYSETSRATGSQFGAVVAYFAGEGVSATASLPKWRAVTFEGRKLIGVGYATSELMEDSELFAAGLREAFVQEMTWQLEDAVFTGNSASGPAGMISSPAAITVSKATQGSATIVSANITGMYDRLVPDCLPNAAWFINPDAGAQLRTLSLEVGTAGGGPLWMWNGDASPYPRLMGLPVIPTEHNAALGSLGDIILADLTAYRIVDRAPVDSLSLDAAFISDQVVFRMTYRLDGKPKYVSPVTLANSSTTRSPFVILQAR